MRGLICLLLTLPLSGCLLEVMTTTAVQGELAARQLKGAKKQIARAQGMASETEITQAIKVYQGEKGSNPPSLDALVPEYLPAIPAKADGSAYGYDPATGALLDQPLPATPAAADWTKLDQLRAAIQQYGTDTTWYPATLQDLVPKYLPAVPAMADGRAFVYDNQSGQVYMPEAQPAPAAPKPAYGTSPVAAETVGAIGISQQLDNMSTAGTSAAGSRGRASTQQVGGNYSDRQMQTADELGL
jgi:hypothetical protein